ncbi:hypothetical protein ACFWFU_06970 [Streptomyces sp. NPDC060235]|uniref:hypothetical protein n=1 Tax=Streptomyces sp. NPDC060235 TaxID=3347080 RepID=UPI0036645772
MHPQPQRHVEQRGANHGLHLVLSILTCGLWAITGWPIAAAIGRKTVTYAQPQLPPMQQQPQYGYPPQQQYGQQPYPPQPYGAQPPPQYGPPPGYGQQPPGQYPPHQ